VVDDQRKHPHEPGRCRSCSTAKKINADSPVHEGPSKGGRPRVKDEVILLAVLYRLREGCSWRALSIFAPFSTIYTRWRRWNDDGDWTRVLEALATGAAGQLWAIDSTCCKVHKHAAGGPEGSEAQSIGSTKGGSNTKIHALVDARGMPVRLLLSAGNRNDINLAPGLVEGLDSRWILADKAYDCDWFRLLLKELGLKACIPPKSGRNHPATYHSGFYKKRHHVENFFQRIKEYRAIATRYEKLAHCFLGLATLAAIMIWLKS
jgi:transposase